MKKRICKKMLGILFCMLLLGTSITLAGLNSDTKKTSDFNELSNQTMDESNERYMSQEIIIKFKEPPKNDVILFENGILNTGFSSVDDILNTKYHVIAAETVFNRNKASVGDTLELQLFYKFTLSEEQDIFLAIDEVNKNSFVAYAGPNNIMTTCRIPDDPYYYSHGSWCNDYMDLYGMHLINTSAAWDISTGGDDVVVAVVDTGVDYNHGDIATNMWINEDEDPTNGIDDDGDGFIDNIYGADFINNDGDPLDDHWHGTHCAGTIAGVGNNSLGVVGVNWQCRIMAVKGLSNTGFGSSETLANAIVWAADNGADVISNSWSHYTRVPSDPVVEAAVHYAYDAGCVIVFAAGNNEDDVQYYCPQNMDETITVAATDWNDVKAWFSNWGELVDVCAPGIYILSLRAEGLGTQWRVVGENYYIASGTSMACPHVAGLAALLLSLVPHLSNTEVAERIIAMTDNIDVVNPDYVGLLGSGRINAFKTLQVFEHNIGVRSVDVPTHIKSNEMTYVNTTIFNR